MKGRAQLAANRARLDATFERVEALEIDNLEVLSDFARYLCVLVSGYIETSVTELAIDFCHKNAAPRVSKYAGSQLIRLQNIKTERLLQIVGSFDPNWRIDLDNYLEGPRKDALDSVVDLRNKIAHGESVGVTYHRIREYYNRITEIIDFLIKQFD